MPWFPKGTLVRNTRQVSIVSTEELALIAEALGVPQVLAAWLGANLELAGVPRLTQLPPGTRLFFPEDATLVVDGENEPCRTAGRAAGGALPGACGAGGPVREGGLPSARAGGVGGAARASSTRETR